MPRKRPPRHDDAQLDFDRYFEVPKVAAPAAGSLNVCVEFRNGLARAVKESPLSRAEIAARMTDLVFGDAGDGDISKTQIDAWTAPSREAWRFPLEYPRIQHAAGAPARPRHPARAAGG